MSSARVLKDWIERDLTAEGATLPQAFEVDEQVRLLADVITAGRHPVVNGPAGVGKSALIYELIRRGDLPAPLAGKRIIQISLRNRMSQLLKADEMRPAFQKLVEVLLAEPEIAPFFRDLHLAYEFDLEPQLQVLGMRSTSPILGEADGAVLEQMFEGTPDLEQHFIGLPIREPSLPLMEKILAAWAAAQEKKGKVFREEALHEALSLAHRFLARTNHPRKTLDFLQTVASLVPPGRPVTESDIVDRFYQTHRVPRFLIDPEMPFDVDATEKNMNARVLGQTDAVRTVMRMISLIKASLSDPRRPFGAFLFVGPTGVGKTHIAQMLAELLFGSRDRMIRINMADYPGADDADTLFGNPDGFNLRLRRGNLTLRLASHPFAVLLLDEFEKAHESVHDRFLQLVDEGQFINGANETIPCRSLIVIATSNAGAEVYRRGPIGFTTPTELVELDRELDRLLFKHFRVEFLNRFDQVVHFHPLTREHIRTIAMREIEELRERAGLKSRGFPLEVDEEILDWLTAHGYDPHFGARFLKRMIERHVTTVLAEAIVRERLEKGSKIALSVRSGKVVASVVARPRPEKAAVTMPLGKVAVKQVLDRKALATEAELVLARAQKRLAELETQKRESSDVLAEMNGEGFWKDPVHAQSVLAKYRALDVAIQTGTRFAETISRLPDLREQALGRSALVPAFARGLEAAARALAQWEERAAEEGASAVWLQLRTIDPLEDGSAWLCDLAEMEVAWCKRLNLAAEIAALGLTDESLTRIVLEVEGSGAAAYLAMEAGIHRLHRAERTDLRVRVDVIAKGRIPDDGLRHVTRVKRKHDLATRVGLDLAFQSKLRLPDRGITIDLYANRAETLAHLTQDLENAPERVATPPVARAYADSGSGARDPRTGAVVPRYKDVMRGRLEPLLEGFRGRA